MKTTVAVLAMGLVGLAMGTMLPAAEAINANCLGSGTDTHCIGYAYDSFNPALDADQCIGQWDKENQDCDGIDT